MRWSRITIIAVVVLVALGALYLGIKLRRAAFEQTMDIRFIRNIRNAYLWGRNARAAGVFNIYNRVEVGERFPWLYELDYPPLRLATVTTWQAWTARNYPDVKDWKPEYEFTAPLLWTNTIAALASSILTFLLIRMWITRADDAQRPKDIQPRAFRGVVSGMIGAMIVWFNPAAIWDGYVWVQWDMWLVPFFLAAVYLACLNWWFAAGVSLAIGTLFKGQLLIAAPILLLWPIFRLRFDALFKIIAGMSIAFMLIIFPWLNLSNGAFVWFLLMLCAMGIVAPISLRWKFSAYKAIALAVIAILISWPWTSGAKLWMQLIPISILGIIVLSRFLPPQLLPHIYALAVAGVIALTIPLHGADAAWFRRGLAFGAEHSSRLHDIGTYNIPSMLMTYLQWRNDNRTPVTVPLLGERPIRTVLATVYGISLLICAFAAARLERKGDSRFLIAIWLPWFLLYLILPQMFCRYLMWAGTMCALLLAAGAGVTLLGIIITGVALVGIIHNHYQLIGQDQNLQQTLRMLEPHLGWGLVLMALIFLYVILVPRRRALRI